MLKSNATVSVLLVIWGVVVAAPVESQPPIFLTNCYIKPVSDVTLSSRSSDPGPLMEINVKEGQKVSEGEQLAKLDDEVYRLFVKRAEEIDQDRTAIERAEEVVELRKWEFDKKKRIEEALAPDELKQAELEHKIALLDLAAQKMQHSLNKHDLKRYARLMETRRIVSPINGVVEKIYKQVGEAVQLPEPVIRVVNLDRIKTEAALNESFARTVKVGDTATIAVEQFADRPLRGEVVHITLVDFSSHTFIAVIEADNPDGLIRPGMSATVEIDVQRNSTAARAPE